MTYVSLDAEMAIPVHVVIMDMSISKSFSESSRLLGSHWFRHHFEVDLQRKVNKLIRATSIFTHSQSANSRQNSSFWFR